MALQIGRQGQLYVVAESTQGTIPSFASADAVRHINFGITYDPKQRRHSPEKTIGPGRNVRFDSREIAAWNLECLIRPSGTINTLPEASEIFEAAFGAKSNVILSTTVASGGTVNGCTLTSGAGLVADQSALLITCPDGKKRVRVVDTVAGAVVTWTPPLPVSQQPSNGAAVKSCLVYYPTTVLTATLAIAHYLKKTDLTAGLSRVVNMAMVEKFAFMADANEEPRFTASGPGQRLGTAAAQPGSFTTVGGNPANGTVGEIAIGATALAPKFLKLAIEMSNATKLRNESYGFSAAEEGFRVGRRDCTVALDMRAEDQTQLYDLTIAGTNVQLGQQTGFTEGNIVYVHCPNVEFKVPDTDDPDEEVNWPFKGIALESAIGLNDEFRLCLA
jgi:hypothetical protein